MTSVSTASGNRIQTSAPACPKEMNEIEIGRTFNELLYGKFIIWDDLEVNHEGSTKKIKGHGQTANGEEFRIELFMLERKANRGREHEGYHNKSGELSLTIGDQSHVLKYHFSLINMVKLNVTESNLRAEFQFQTWMSEAEMQYATSSSLPRSA